MSKEQEKKSTTVKDVPQYIEDASRNLVNSGQALASKPFQAYTDPRVAAFTGDQTNAFQKLRDTVANSPIVLPEALNGARAYAAAPAQNVSTERVVDENGRLGAISDYINPGTEAALMPALRKIAEAAQSQRLQSRAAATSSGSFGDARHGIVDAGIDKSQDLAVGDTSSAFFRDAFDKAMGARGTDLNRMLQTDTANAGYNETALNRGMTGSGALLDRASSDQQRQLQQIQALLSGGNQQQANQQAGLDANYGEAMRGYGHDFNVLQALTAALKGTAGSYDTTSTTTQTQPDNSLLQLAGSVAGQAIPALLTGGASLPFTMGAQAATGGMSGGGWSNTGGGWNPNVAGGYAYPGYAEGGRPEVGAPAIVGERGPEMFVPDQAGTVVPNEVMQALLQKIMAGAPAAEGAQEGAQVMGSPPIADIDAANRAAMAARGNGAAPWPPPPAPYIPPAGKTGTADHAIDPGRGSPQDFMRTIENVLTQLGAR